MFFLLNYSFITLSPAVIAQIWILTEEPVIPIEIPTQEAKADLEVFFVNAEVKKSKCSM